MHLCGAAHTFLQPRQPPFDEIVARGRGLESFLRRLNRSAALLEEKVFGECMEYGKVASIDEDVPQPCAAGFCRQAVEPLINLQDLAVELENRLIRLHAARAG